VGLEAACSFNVARGLQSLGYSVDLYETRRLSKFLRVRRNKTDAGDAFGIAEAGRLGGQTLSKVFLKSFECQALQSRLAIRAHIITQRVATMNLLCRQIEDYGGRLVGKKNRVTFAAKVEAEMRKVFGRAPTPLSDMLRELLEWWRHLIVYQNRLDRDLSRAARQNEVCQRFMAIPGVGPICALSFYAAVCDPARFTRSADIGPYFGLTPRLHQSGLSVRAGRISRMGNKTVRTLLVTAGIILMRSSTSDLKLREWALSVGERRGAGKARVALARKLAVVMIALWKTGQDFRPQTAPGKVSVATPSQPVSDPDS
jgi:transposase